MILLEPLNEYKHLEHYHEALQYNKTANVNLLQNAVLDTIETIGMIERRFNQIILALKAQNRLSKPS